MKFGFVRTVLFTGLLAARVVTAGTLVQFRTMVGEVDVELFDHDKPITVGNFIRYVQSNYYQNTFFHRCVPGFVLQGGGFGVLTPSSTNQFTSFFQIPTFGAISNEFATGPFLSNTNWTIAMAKVSGDPNSATSQFFFNLTNNNTGTNSLDLENGGFTVFGRVVNGTNVLAGFNNLSLFNGIMDMELYYPATNVFALLFSQLPVLYLGTAYPRYSNLFYVDITLLNVQVAPLPDRAREISWTSVAGETNLVEFTTNFPPVWQTLTATNGTGLSMMFSDASTNNLSRFYRVRVDY